MKIELKITADKTRSYRTNSDSASPPKSSIDDYQSHPIKSKEPAWHKPCGLFCTCYLSLAVRDDPPESSENGYTFRYTLKRRPKNVYPFTEDRPYGMDNAPCRSISIVWSIPARISSASGRSMSKTSVLIIPVFLYPISPHADKQPA